MCLYVFPRFGQKTNISNFFRKNSKGYFCFSSLWDETCPLSLMRCPETHLLDGINNLEQLSVCVWCGLVNGLLAFVLLPHLSPVCTGPISAVLSEVGRRAAFSSTLLPMAVSETLFFGRPAAAGGSHSATTTAGHRRRTTSPPGSSSPRRWCARRCTRWCRWSWWWAPAGCSTSTPTARAGRSARTSTVSTSASTASTRRPGDVAGSWLGDDWGGGLGSYAWIKGYLISVTDDVLLLVISFIVSWLRGHRCTIWRRPELGWPKDLVNLSKCRRKVSYFTQKLSILSKADCFSVRIPKL